MYRWGFAIGLTALVASALPAAALDRAVPNLDYVSTCRATPPVAMDQKQTFDSCVNDEKQARKDLPAQWVRSSPQWRDSCLTQTTLGGLPSYVELLTCLEMHDPSPPSLNRPGVAGTVTPDVGSPAQRGLVTPQTK